MVRAIGSPQRLLIFNDTADLVGGAERGVLMMARRLDEAMFAVRFASFRDGIMARELAKSGIATCLLSAHPSILEPRNRLLYHPARSALFARHLVHSGAVLARHIRDSRIKLVYTYSTKGHLVSLAAAPWHDAVVVWDFRELATPAWFVSVLSLLARSRVAAVFVQTRQAEVELARWFARSQIARVPNCIDPDDPAFSSAATDCSARSRLGLCGNRTVLISAGRMSPLKGFDILIDAVKHVPDVETLICGGAEHEHERRYLEDCRNRARRAGISERVRFLGHRGDMSELIAASDLAVSASRSEQQSRFIMEAMLLKRPVIATDVGGTREMLRAPHGGWVVAPDSAPDLAAAIARLAKDERSRRELGERAHSLVCSHFSVGAHMAAKHELLGQLVHS